MGYCHNNCNELLTWGSKIKDTSPSFLISKWKPNGSLNLELSSLCKREIFIWIKRVQWGESVVNISQTLHLAAYKLSGYKNTQHGLYCRIYSSIIIIMDYYGAKLTNLEATSSSNQRCYSSNVLEWNEFICIACTMALN